MAPSRSAFTVSTIRNRRRRRVRPDSFTSGVTRTAPGRLRVSSASIITSWRCCCFFFFLFFFFFFLFCLVQLRIAEVAVGVYVPLGLAVALPWLWGLRLNTVLESAGTVDTATAALLIVELFASVLVAMLADVVVAVVTIRLVPEGIEAGVPALLAASSVGTGVPMDRPASSPVVRLSAPIGIGTTTFKPDPTKQRIAILVASHQASAQLEELAIAPKASEREVPTIERSQPAEGSPSWQDIVSRRAYEEHVGSTQGTKR